MRRYRPFAILLATCSFACSSGTSSGGSTTGGTTDPPPPPQGHPSPFDGGTVDGAAPPATDDAGPLATVAMPRISGGVPAFASSGDATKANDDDTTTNWVPDSLPGWIAYDLSSVPAAQRANVVVAWNAEHAIGYVSSMPTADMMLPLDYTLEINTAPGGGAPPTSGWTEVARVTSNVYNTVETPVALGSASWLRMNVTRASDVQSAIDLDVFSAPHGASDAWLFMGDSITFMTMWYPFNDIPKLVHATRPDRFPAVVNAAIGGTRAVDGLDIIDGVLQSFPGRYVVLAYGTNGGDVSSLDALVNKVVAAGKVPVIPRIPWPDEPNLQPTIQMENAYIDALYTKYPAILRGPDLWATFENRTDLIPPGDIHPNSAGQEVLRQAWATVMAKVP